jgi:ATP-dependent Clp protease ATP-binding subunit ClpB
VNSDVFYLHRGQQKMADNEIKTTKLRLEEIAKEQAELNKKYDSFRLRWEKEKNTIQRIRNYKAQIEEAKQKADEYEREGDLSKVAEIRYGTIHELENKLKIANSKLQKMQANGVLLKEEVDAEDIAQIIAHWTGIPIDKMLESERTKLVKMEDRIHDRLIGQNDAVAAVANAIRRSRAGLQEQDKPIGSFIFLGTTGVGKTELARALAEFLFDDESAMIRIDMSEYMEKHSTSRLIGAPPGYIGYDEGGQLTEAVRRRPYSVVLLDEIEKAHSEVFNVLLQLLDDGRMTDGKGRVVNFKNTIIIMTSNLGTDIIQEKMSAINSENKNEIMEETSKELMNHLRKHLRPEFLNRIDEIIVFNPLTDIEIEQIARLQLKKLVAKFALKQITLTFTDASVRQISKLGFDIQYGARPLKRAIQKYIVDPLAMKILEGDFAAGDKILAHLDSNTKFVFSKAGKK